MSGWSDKDLIDAVYGQSTCRNFVKRHWWRPSDWGQCSYQCRVCNCPKFWHDRENGQA